MEYSPDSSFLHFQFFFSRHIKKTIPRMTKEEVQTFLTLKTFILVQISLLFVLGASAWEPSIGVPRRSIRVVDMKGNLAEAKEFLSAFDKAYTKRIHEGRSNGMTPRQIDFAHAQALQTKGIKRERTELRDSIITATETSNEVVLGIMSATGHIAISSLKAWLEGTCLPKGSIVRTVDEDGQELQPENIINGPVYLKYNSSDPEGAYMKRYEGGFTGVLFQPVIQGDDDFYQFGNLPLACFPVI